MKRAVIALLVLLAGCTPPMSNDDIIVETRKCEAAGLRAAHLSSWSSRDLTSDVVCRPKESP